MTERQLRAQKRKKTMTLNKVDLHSPYHNSFHLDYSVTQAWNLLYSMSIKEWEEKTGKTASTKVNKNKIKFISLKEKNKE